MAKKIEEEIMEENPKKTDRENRWEAFVEKYKKENPAKYEKKKEELKTIPETF